MKKILEIKSKINDDKGRNNDLVENLREIEYLQREGVVFSEKEKSEIIILCEEIIEHFNNDFFNLYNE